MMNNERKEHLWIPDEEVIRLDKTLTARPTPRNISFAEHRAVDKPLAKKIYI